MQNSITVFAFYILDRKHHLWPNLVQKIKIVSLSLNFAPRFVQNMQNSMVVFPFSVFYWKHPFFTVSVTVWEWRLWNRQLLSTWLFYLVVVSVYMECFCALPWKLLNNLTCEQTFCFTWINFLPKSYNCQILIQLFK